MAIDSYVFSSNVNCENSFDYALNHSASNAELFIVTDCSAKKEYGKVTADLLKKILGDAVAGEISDDLMGKAFEETNKRIIDLNQQNAAELKSSAAALCVIDKTAFWAHIGNARLYYIHNNEIESVTADHTTAFEQMMKGDITRNMLVASEKRRELTNSFGSEITEPFDVEKIAVQEGDAFLLCTDGFWENLMDNEILLDYHKADSAAGWARLMMLRAMERFTDEHDNLSLITVML